MGSIGVNRESGSVTENKLSNGVFTDSNGLSHDFNRMDVSVSHAIITNMGGMRDVFLNEYISRGDTFQTVSSYTINEITKVSDTEYTVNEIDRRNNEVTRTTTESEEQIIRRIRGSREIRNGRFE